MFDFLDVERVFSWKKSSLRRLAKGGAQLPPGAVQRRERMAFCRLEGIERVSKGWGLTRWRVSKAG